jgi:hypothetical protein
MPINTIPTRFRSLLLATIAILLGTTACDTTGIEDALEDINVVVELPPIEVYSSLLFIDAATGNIITDQITVTFEGDQNPSVIDYTSKPITSLTTNNGSAAFGINSNAAPTLEEPIELQFAVNSDNYMAESHTVTLIDTSEFYTIELSNLTNLPSNIDRQFQTVPSDASGAIMDSVEVIHDFPFDQKPLLKISEGARFGDGNGNVYTGNITIESTFSTPYIVDEYSKNTLPVSIAIDDTTISTVAVFNLDISGSGKVIAKTQNTSSSKPSIWLSIYTAENKNGGFNSFGEPILYKAAYQNKTGEKKYLRQLSKKKFEDIKSVNGDNTLFTYIYFEYEWPEDLITTSEIFLDTYVPNNVDTETNCLINGTRVFHDDSSSSNPKVYFFTDKFSEYCLFGCNNYRHKYKFELIKTSDNEGYLFPLRVQSLYLHERITYGFWDGLVDLLYGYASIYIPEGEYRIGYNYPSSKEFTACEDLKEPIDLTSNGENRTVDVDVNIACGVSGQKPTVSSIPLSRVYYQRTDFNEWFSSSVDYDYDPDTQTLLGGSFKINTVPIDETPTYKFRYYYGDEMFTGDLVVDSDQITINETIDSEYCQ